MFYSFTFALPAKGSGLAPEEKEINLTHGIIHYLEVGFPPGCKALAHLKILHHRHQVWPSNLDGDFAYDGYVIPIHEFYPFEEPPHNLTLIGWNEDDTYPHTLTVRIGILPREVLIPPRPELGLISRIARALGIR